jgi:Lhr-like helicase
MTDWRKYPGFFRLSKFEVNRWFDGQPHLIRRGADFPEVMADEDIIHRLRNAATYRNVQVAITATPAGLIVQSHRDPGWGVDENGVAEQLFQAEEQVETLQETVNKLIQFQDTELKALKEEVSVLARDMGHELSLLKEELSLLKRRRP